MYRGRRQFVFSSYRLKLAHLFSTWYFWVALLVALMMFLSAIVLCILCCCKSRKPKSIAQLLRPTYPTVLRTAQDPEGIIQPDVMFYSRSPAKEVQVIATAHPISKEDFRITTPIKPLTPAYHPSQQVTISTANNATTTSNELTLPPGYVANRETKYH